MRTRKHYETMIESNPGTTWGLSLAAQAVYAAKTGMFDRNADDFDDKIYRSIYLRLQKKYGEALSPDEVHTEMNLITAMSYMGSQRSDAKTRAARENAKKGGRPKGSGDLTDLQKQIYDMRVSGLKIKEIAHQTDRRPENIRQILARAAHKLGIKGGWTEI